MKSLICLLILLFPFNLIAQEQGVDENELFSKKETVVETKKVKPEDEQAKKHLGISGEVSSVNQYLMTPGFFSNPKNSQNNLLYPYILGSLILDARSADDDKIIGNMEALYSSRTSTTVFSMKELFVQFNLQKTFYFTIGKQVLSWGRTYLWNPSDLLNVEKKTFLQKVGSKEGTYGMKIHVPFGTRFNMYGFADMYKAKNADEISGAYKFEFLAGNTEAAVSIWGKKAYHPVYALDLSTRILGLDILGEGTLSKGENAYKVSENSGILSTYRDNNRTVAKASINIGRSFEALSQPEKISIHTEFFYNGEGSANNIFADKNNYLFDSPVTIKDIDGNLISLAGGDKKTYLIGKNIYDANYYSRYYLALFTSVNKFFTSSLTLNINLISNLSQKSYILSTGIDYLNLSNFKCSFYINTYFGKADTEYTIAGYRADLFLQIGLIF